METTMDGANRYRWTLQLTILSMAIGMVAVAVPASSADAVGNTCGRGT
jgi:hypothetical protein